MTDMINLKVWVDDEGKYVCEVTYLEGNAKCSRSCTHQSVIVAMQDIAEFIQRNNMR